MTTSGNSSSIRPGTPLPPTLIFQSITDLTSPEENPSQKYEPEEDDLILDLPIPTLQRQTCEKPVQITPQAGYSLSENGGLVMPAELAKKLGASLDKLSPEQQRAAILFSQIPVPKKPVAIQLNLAKPVIKDESMRDFFEQLVKIQQHCFPAAEDRVALTENMVHTEIRHVFEYDEVFAAFKKRTYPCEIMDVDNPLRRLPQRNRIRLWIDTSWKTLWNDEPCVKYEKAGKTAMKLVDDLIQACFKETSQQIKTRCAQAFRELAPILFHVSEAQESMGLCQELVSYLDKMHRYLPLQTFLTPPTIQHTNPQATEVVFPHPFYVPKSQVDDSEEFELPKTITINKSSIDAEAETLSMLKFYTDYAEFQNLHCCFLKNLISPMVKVIGVIKGFPGPYGFMAERPAANGLLLGSADADKSSKENKDNKQNGEG